MSKLHLFFTGLSGWFHIFLFPVLISLMLSLIVFLTMPAAIGIALGLLLLMIGMLVGIIMATRILRRRGAAGFIRNDEEVTDPENEQKEETN